MTPADEVTYCRAPHCAFRWVRGTIYVGRPGTTISQLEGAAALVWAALATPGRRDELAGRIGVRWPDLPRDDAGHLDDALILLSEQGFVLAGERP